MTSFKFQGKQRMAFSIPDQDVILVPGSTVELPETNAHVKTLLAKGYLVKEPVKSSGRKKSEKEINPQTPNENE